MQFCDAYGPLKIKWQISALYQILGCCELLDILTVSSSIPDKIFSQVYIYFAFIAKF